MQKCLFDFSELKNTIETQVNELKSQIESKCVMQ
ncbi:Complexin-like Protein [Tribolium castaneum]|uniref:Complexin-like Protein n=1 Tax=Tribolium castaneum TaxID=7070 RepID=A0A139WB72_TRICA|nr:Complexin-like Protein [Tribolium castaneum]